MTSLLNQLLLCKYNPSLYACNQIREFESLSLKTLFSDCTELYAELQKMHPFCDDAIFSDAINVLLDLFLNQEENGPLKLCKFTVVLFAPIVKNYVSDGSKYISSLYFDSTDSFFDEIWLAFYKKYCSHDVIEFSSDNSSNSENDDSNENTSIGDIYNPRFCPTSSLTTQYNNAFSNCKIKKSYGGLISKAFAYLQISIDGRTNKNWLPECLPQFIDERIFDSDTFQNSIGYLLKVTLFPMVMVLDDDYYHKLQETV